MYFLITVKNTGDMHEFNKAFYYFKNSYTTIEYYKDKEHAHLLIHSNKRISVFDFLGKWKCYVHVRQVRDRKEDVDRVREYIRDHYRGGDRMDIGHVKVWIKRNRQNKIVLTIQAPDWYDLSNNRMTITWTTEQFKQFITYIIGELIETTESTESNKQYSKKSTQKREKSSKKFTVRKGFDKAVRR